jgi:hypothetical protein
MKNEFLNENGNLKKVYLIAGSVIVTCVIILASYFLYQRFTLTEDEAKNASNRFLNMLVMKNNYDQFEDIYPDFNQIGARVVPNELPKINNISKNSEGDFEVYTSIGNIPIFLLISKSNNKAIIKSSKGISYAYYNKELEYGKKKGCLTGIENDVEMGIIIKNKNLSTDLELETDLRMSLIYSKLKVSDNIKEQYNYASGTVTITNENDFSFEYGDIDCTVEFYNSNGDIVNSSELSFYDIKANSSASTSVFADTKNAVKFNIIRTVKNSDRLKNKIRDIIVSETDFGCK